MTSIVQLNVTQTVAPTPATLQKSGAIVSQGATNTSPGTSSLLTQTADLTPLLTGGINLTSLSWASTSGGQVTASTATNHGIVVGEEFTIAGCTPTGYNGTFIALSGTAGNVVVYALATNPGAASTLGVFTNEDVGELVSQVDTFFAQGSQQAVYVLELGAGTPSQGVAALSAYITANPNSNYTPGASGFFYSYLVPRTWDSNADFLALLALFNSTTARTYFFVTTTLQNYKNYTNLMKCVMLFIEAPVFGQYAANVLTALSYASTTGQVTASTTTAHGVVPGDYFTISGCAPNGYNGTFLALPGTAGSVLVYAVATNPGASTVLGTLQESLYPSTGIPATEFSAAAAFWVTLNYAPSTTNKVTPLSYSFVFGVTPFPVKGNQALLATLKAAGVNVIGTGAEGGISNTILLYGTTMDLNPFNYWYAADWAQINVDVNISNAVINGSNDPINPLYYNQDGINRLQQVAANTMASGVTFGMVLGTVIQTGLDGPAFTTALDAGTYDGKTVVNAVPFIPYSKENPGDYKIGKYGGFAIMLTPLRGFDTIVFNVNVSSFVVQ